MNILIVDDEYYIVQGILKSVNWDSLNIQEKYCAYSMKQALDLLEEKEIHIVLTDIEMPKGSGLDLIEEINRRSYSMIKLLLTGHENFDYAKKALELGCSQYLVKPIQSESLESVLHDAINKFKQTQEIERAKQLANSWNTSTLLKYNRFWSELFNGTLNSQEAIHQAIVRYDLDRSWISSEFRLIVLHHYPSPISRNSSRHDWLVLERSLITDQGLFYSIDSDNCLIIDMDNRDSSTRVHTLLKQLYPNDIFTLYISQSAPLKDASTFLKLTHNFLKSYFSTGNLTVHLSSSTSDVPTHTHINSLNYEVWSRLVVENRSDLILKEIESFYIKRNILYALSDLRFIYQQLFHAVMNAVESTGRYNDQSAKSFKLLSEEDSASASLDCLLDWANRLLSEASQLLHHDNNHDVFLSRVKKHVRDNLSSKNLNRNSIAEEIHMNPDYISYLFHKLSGQHLSTYISNERIHEAKKLLLTSNIPLQEVAIQSGYSNTSYFHKQFKKATGMTPQQFRKQRI